nr:MAG TPA: hypothetical protein [Caudoviricetes sp.]
MARRSFPQENEKTLKNMLYISTYNLLYLRQFGRR